MTITTDDTSKIARPDARFLTAQDRCDGCGAQAYVRITLTNTGGRLLLCAHHARESIDTLLPQCSEWLDETRFLEA